MQPKKQSITLFSETADAETASLIRRIPGRHDRFATDFIGVEGQVAVRLEAWRNEGGDAWAIDRFTYAPALDRMEKTVEARPGLCFFDALHHCAKFETSELAGHDGRQIVAIPDPEWKDPASWQDAAKAASQIIGDDGMPHPCAAGRVLTGGIFTTAAMKTAMQTESRDLLPITGETAGLTRSLISADSAPPGQTPLAIYRKKSDARRDKIEVANLFNEAVRAGQSLTEGIARLANLKFKSDVPVLRSSLTLGLAPAAGYLRGDPRYAPQRHFDVLKADYRKCVQKLSDGPEKTALEGFARQAESALWMERAARLVANDQESDHRSDARIRLALDHIGTAAQAENLSALDTERLKSECMDKGLPPLSFIPKLRAAWDASSLQAIASFYGLDPAAPIGSQLDDKTIFAGISPSTGFPLFTTADYGHDVWAKAVTTGRCLRDCHGRDGSRDGRYANLMKEIAQGTHDHGWRLPTFVELKILAGNRARGALAQSFTSSDHDREYWCSQTNEEDRGYYLNVDKGTFGTHSAVPCSIKYVFS